MGCTDYRYGPSAAMLVHYFTNRGIYYGWVVIGVVFVTLFMVLGVRFAFGVFYVAILAETGWQRAETAGLFSVSMGVYAISMIFVGALFDRFGPRRVFPVAIVVLCLGLMLCSTIDTMWRFYVYYGLLVGLALAPLGFPTHMAVVPRWFVRKRGLAAGLALSGVGIGSLLIALLSQWLIGALGWRNTYLLFALVMLPLLVPLNALGHRNSPEELGLHPDGAASSEGQPGKSTQEGFTIAHAMRSPAWWFLLLAVTMMGFIIMTMAVHQTQLSVDLGYDLTTASALYGLTGLTRTVGQLTWGALSDRFGRNPIYLLVTVLGVIGVLFLILAKGSPHLAYLLSFSILFGFGYMGISPVYASTVADLFPGRHLGKILSVLDIGFGSGAVIGPWLAGYLFDRFGHHDYTLALLILGMIITGLAMFAATRRRPVYPTGVVPATTP